jgi:hypothetical protein
MNIAWWHRFSALTTGTISLAGNPDLDCGAGYTGGGWPAEPNEHDNNIAYPDYFNGRIAAISLTGGASLTRS